MSHKRVLFKSAAREKVLRGATLLSDAVRVTLGPKSRSVLIGKPWGSPIVCNDGVTIAKEFELEEIGGKTEAHFLTADGRPVGELHQAAHARQAIRHFRVRTFGPSSTWLPTATSSAFAPSITTLEPIATTRRRASRFRPARLG